MYLELSPNDELPQEEARLKLMDCAKGIKSFPNTNEMKQNDDKTEVLIIGNSCLRKYVQYNHINICNAQVN